MPIYWDEQKKKGLLQKLKMVQRRQTAEAKEGLEVSANLVISHAKRNHVRGKSLTPWGVRLHRSRRFYVWSERLVNSMHAGKVTVYKNGLQIAVHASESYAAAVEKGGPNRRAFPFFGPAIKENRARISSSIMKAMKKVHAS